MTRWTQMPVLMLAGFCIFATASASADTYSVFSCRSPAGGPAPTAGWTGSASGAGMAADSCASGGALSAVLPEATPPGNASATWRFAAPPATTIVSLLAQRKTQGLGKSTQPRDVSYTLFTDTATPLEDCAPAANSACTADFTDPISKQGLAGNSLTFQAQCLNAGGTCSRPLRVDFGAILLGLKDTAAPVVANPRLLDGGDTSGVLKVGFDAADAGGGLYRALIKVDGKPARALPLGPPPCLDAQPADTDPYQFTVPVPCPPLVKGATAEIDVKSLPAGPHAVEVAVEDAAGNQASVYGPLEFPKLNTASGSSTANTADVLNARLRMWFAGRTRPRSKTSRYGRRVVTRGVLRDRKGRGIQGARIDVYHIRNGKKRLLKTGLKSRAKGALTLILPLNVDTRRVQYVYRALRPGPATSTQSLRLTVRNKKGRVYYRGR